MSEFTEELMTELESQPEAGEEVEQVSSNASIIRFLMEFQAVEKLPQLVTGDRSDSD